MNDLVKMNGIHSVSIVYHRYSDSVSRFVQNFSKKVRYLWRYCPFDLKSAQMFVVLPGCWNSYLTGERNRMRRSQTL